MNCKKPFNDEFMFKHLNKSYCKTEFKDHRKKILFDLEVSKIPETIPLVERHVKADELGVLNAELNNEIRRHYSEIRKLEDSIRLNAAEIYNLTHRTPKHEKREFIMPCMTPDCRGFLSTAYKCEICKNFTCPHCLELIGEKKDDNEHTCNPDCVKNAEEIKKNTRPCPSCGTRIFKIDGCDQIWCTECHVAFSWNTGKIDNGVVHNPHFYEWKRNGGGEARQMGANALAAAAEGCCGGAQPMANWMDTRRRLMNAVEDAYRTIRHYYLTNETDTNNDLLNSQYDSIMNYLKQSTYLHRMIEHIINVIIPTHRRLIEECGNHTDNRIKYVLKKLDETEFKTIIWRKTTQRKKLVDHFFIYELISQVGVDFFRDLDSKEIKDSIDKFRTTPIRTYMSDMNYKDYDERISQKKKEEVETKKITISYINDILSHKFDQIKQFFHYCNGQFERLSLVNGDRVFYVYANEQECERERRHMFSFTEKKYPPLVKPRKSNTDSEKTADSF